MIYDEKLVEEYRKLAVTTADEFTIGETYYQTGFHMPTNSFVLRDKISMREAWRLAGLDIDKGVGSGEHFRKIPEEEKSEIAWFLVKDILMTHSMKDNNIGASYNPWLIFRNKEDRDEYLSKLNVVYNTMEDDYA